MDPLKTGSIIYKARKRLNMTQKELADKVYVSDKAVSKWERGICFPDISVLIQLAEVLEISLYDLLKGEKMNKKEVEEVLRKTINYSNSEIGRKKKRYFIVSFISILIIIILSIVMVILSNNQTSGTIDRDEIYSISYYIDYKTELKNDNDKKIENLLDELPFSWIDKTYSINEDEIKINYSKSFNELIKDYNDEKYVKLAIINNSTILFTLVANLETIKIEFNDYIFIVKKEDIINNYSLSSFDYLLNDEVWKEKISSKLVKDNFIDDTFKNIFKKKDLKYSK